MARLAVYAGSFDPATEGHLDIVRRAAAVFDELIVAVADNPQKKQAFPVEERKGFIRAGVQLPNVSVDGFSGLLVDYLRSKKSRIVIRGLRAVSDFEYEFQLASMNHHLYPELETVFMMPDERYTYLSSSMVKEVAALGGRLSGLVPSVVEAALQKKYLK